MNDEGGGKRGEETGFGFGTTRKPRIGEQGRKGDRNGTGKEKDARRKEERRRKRSERCLDVIIYCCLHS
jgi:hypothetical protein